ncbi:polysaccharide biosynthesis protein [Bacillus sp. S13(2024)]|uniref:putative polysaccharide biosynthesis protein n=1 Tax=unclassified Bacillus (in: firmicutes) TaxID=185979 RepID=UPI003D25F035
MSKTLVKGAAILTITTFLSKLLGSFFQIPLQNIAGDEVLGIFRLVFPVYMLALTLSVAGIPLAISKLIAELQTTDDKEGIAKLFTSASILGALFGTVGFLAIVIWSEPIAAMLGGQETRFPLLVVSFALLFAPYMAVYRGYFQGFGDMMPTGVSQVIEQFVRVLFMLTIAYMFVLSQKSSSVIAGGAMIGSCIGVISSLVYLRWTYVKSAHCYKATSYSFADLKKDGKKILRVSIPIAIGALSMPLLGLIDSVTIPHVMQGTASMIQEQFGIYSRGSAFTQLIVVFASAIVFPLIPLLTTALAKNDRGAARDMVQRTYKLAHLLTTPMTIWLIALAIPLNVGLFTDAKGSSMLAVIIGSSYFTSFVLLSIGILQGINRSMQAAWIVIGASFVKALLNVVLVAKFGIDGAAYSTLLIYILIFITNDICIRKHISYSVRIGEYVSILVVSCVLGIGMYSVTTIIDVTSSRFIALLYSCAATGLASLLYIVCAIKLQWIAKEDAKKIPLLRRWIR